MSSSQCPPLPVFLKIELDHGHDFDEALLGLAGFLLPYLARSRKMKLSKATLRTMSRMGAILS